MALDGWDVVDRSLGELPEYALRKEGYQMFLICSPSGDHIGSGKLRDMGEFKVRVAGPVWPVLCITADKPEETSKEEAMTRKVFLLHYKELSQFFGRDIPAIKSYLSEAENKLKKSMSSRKSASLGCEDGISLGSTG